MKITLNENQKWTRLVGIQTARTALKVQTLIVSGIAIKISVYMVKNLQGIAGDRFSAKYR
ncbi:hypothetical protein NX722_05135 [Endozoicomonas gorgoniicola]|uniref:Uncharacterized protein n=1 Tax=Endozoicomonas gorgoniicola TaxID=1234144 RepID=A0ABT3MRP4_9GAMM|nr:hypothetical protein [Endozoicomonas gorgoniicola]MCW7552035.1 hypothetical protein [Endozoicomonas gorgoniicola]